MRKFPEEFSDLLNAEGRRLAAGKTAKRRRTDDAFFELYDGVIDPATARACIQLLDRHIYSRLSVMEAPIPHDSISSMTRDYSELLPKTSCLKTSMLLSGRYPAYSKAEEIGLLAMLRSESLRGFAEAATGLRLHRAGMQVMCYDTGDYVGPHNDHQPESKTIRDGYVDLHVMFGNDAVAHQWIVYEEDHHFRRIRDVNLQGGIAVYRLPFWHYTTPLAAKPGREKRARRWLLLVSFKIVPPATPG